MKVNALAGNRTPVNCMGRSYTHQYSTNSDVYRHINDTLQQKFTEVSGKVKCHNFSWTKFGLSLTTKPTIYQWSRSWNSFRKVNALAGNRTRVNCLGSSYAHHYTTNAVMYRHINDALQQKFTEVSGKGKHQKTLLFKHKVWIVLDH